MHYYQKFQENHRIECNSIAQLQVERQGDGFASQLLVGNNENMQKHQLLVFGSWFFEKIKS